MKLGIIVHVVPKTNIFIVDIGWGQLRYFFSNKDFQIKDIILYHESYCNYDNSNEIEYICHFDNCEFLGNVRYDFRHPDSENIVIARKDYFIYWDYLGHEKDFDLVSNTLLFLSHAEPRYPLPHERDWLEAYIYAKKKVEEIDIHKIIDEVKVEYHNHSWTRRGSDNVIISNYRISYDYDYHFGYLNDYYLGNFFPKYEVKLYHSEDDECDYIHPDFEKLKINRKPDGSIKKIVESKFKGMDIKEFCLQKTTELRQLTLANFKLYNKDEHINYLAYHHINWYYINKENGFLLKMKGLGEMIWGCNHHNIFTQITQENYQELILSNNLKHPIPQLQDES